MILNNNAYFKYCAYTNETPEMAKARIKSKRKKFGNKLKRGRNYN